MRSTTADSVSVPSTTKNTVQRAARITSLTWFSPRFLYIPLLGAALALAFSAKVRARLALVVMAIALVMTRSRMGNTAFFGKLKFAPDPGGFGSEGRCRRHHDSGTLQAAFDQVAPPGELVRQRRPAHCRPPAGDAAMLHGDGRPDSAAAAAREAGLAESGDLVAVTGGVHTAQPRRVRAARHQNRDDREHDQQHEA